MRRSSNRPILIRRVHLWWYAVALIPILALGWLALTGTISPIFAPIILFALIFWLASCVMAVIAKLRGPRPEPRQ
jgi:hypothetical protein